MKNVERKLLAAFGGIVMVSLSSMNAYLAIEAKNAAEDSGRRLSAERAKNRMTREERDAVSRDIERLKGKAMDFEKGGKDADPIALGSAAKSEFAKNSLEVKSYAVSRGKGASLLEFALEGRPAGLAALLSEEDAGKTSFSVSRCDISKSDTPGLLEASIGISRKRAYAESGPRPSDRDAVALIRSISSIPAMPATKKSPAPSASPPPPAVNAAWIGFIGKTIAEDGIETYFLKDAKNGRMLELRPGRRGDSVISESIDSILIRYEGVLYEIRKK